jgi:hypothetical protein
MLPENDVSKQFLQKFWCPDTQGVKA